ncbi:MAG: hypothetical protein ACXVPN_11390 [Bacteroidia bacterium]
MRIVRRIMLAIALVMVIITGSLFYLGYFSSVKILEKQEGGYVIAGMEVVGPYSKTGQYVTEVNRKLKEADIISVKGFGIYYDDPKMVASEECRSMVGGVVNKADADRIVVLNLKGLKIDSIPLRNAVVAEFPLKNILSYMIAPVKVYPVLSKYVREKNYKPVLSFEIYDRNAKRSRL